MMKTNSQRDGAPSLDTHRFDVAVDNLARPQADFAGISHARFGRLFRIGSRSLVVFVGDRITGRSRRMAVLRVCQSSLVLLDPAEDQVKGS